MKKAAIIAALALVWTCAALTPARAQGKQFIKGQLSTQVSTCGMAASTGYVELQVGNGMGAATFTLGGTWSGTVSFFGSADSGTTWKAIGVSPAEGGSSVTTATGNDTWQFNPGAYDHLCAAFTTASSGNVLATIQLSTASARSNGGGNGGSYNCPGAGGTPNALLVDSGTQGTCMDSSVLAGGTAGTFLYNGFTNALPGTSGTLLNAVPTKYTQWPGCNGKGLGTSGSGSTAVAAGTYVENTCTNDTGATVTLTGLNCFTDNSGTSTLNASGHTLGALLTGAITCSTARATGTQSANVLLTAGDWIVFTFVADGTSKETDWNVTGTY